MRTEVSLRELITVLTVAKEGVTIRGVAGINSKFASYPPQSTSRKLQVLCSSPLAAFSAFQSPNTGICYHRHDDSSSCSSPVFINSAGKILPQPAVCDARFLGSACRAGALTVVPSARDLLYVHSQSIKANTIPQRELYSS